MQLKIIKWKHFQFKSIIKQTLKMFAWGKALVTCGLFYLQGADKKCWELFLSIYPLPSSSVTRNVSAPQLSTWRKKSSGEQHFLFLSDKPLCLWGQLQCDQLLYWVFPFWLPLFQTIVPWHMPVTHLDEYTHIDLITQHQTNFSWRNMQGMA
jgi:hypothetical protein